MTKSSRLTFVCTLLAAQQASADSFDDGELRPPRAVTSTPATPAPVQRRRNPLATTQRWGGGVRLTGLSGIGALPGVNYGGEAAVMVRRDEMFLELALGTW